MGMNIFTVLYGLGIVSADQPPTCTEACTLPQICVAEDTCGDCNVDNGTQCTLEKYWGKPICDTSAYTCGNSCSSPNDCNFGSDSFYVCESSVCTFVCSSDYVQDSFDAQTMCPSATPKCNIDEGDTEGRCGSDDDGVGAVFSTMLMIASVMFMF